MKKACCYLVILLSCYLAIRAPLFKPVFAAIDDSGGGNPLSPLVWGDRCQENGVAKIQGFECIFQNIIRILLPLLAIALFVMLVVGSFEWLTSSGDPKKLQKARSTMTYAIAGLIAFFGIYFIFNLIKTLIGVDLTEFMIPGP